MLGLFSVMLNIQDDVEESSNNRVGNDMGCAMIDCTENNNRLLFFVTVMFFCLCSGNHIHHEPPCRPLLAGSDNIILIKFLLWPKQ